MSNLDVVVEGAVPGEEEKLGFTKLKSPLILTCYDISQGIGMHYGCQNLQTGSECSDPIALQQPGINSGDVIST